MLNAPLTIKIIKYSIKSLGSVYICAFVEMFSTAVLDGLQHIGSLFFSNSVDKIVLMFCTM